MAEDRYDLVVIGAGSAGLVAAPFAARLGARVALVERERPGGDCLYTGCVPSKTLLRVARVAHEARQANRFGLGAYVSDVNLARVMAHVRATIEAASATETPETLTAAGVDYFQGAARFVDPHAVVAGARRLPARHFLICTGARPALPDVAGLADTPYLTSETIWALERLPTHLLVLGGGPVGLELAQAFRRLGSAVTLLTRGDRLLGVADPDVSAALAAILADDGVDVRTGVAVERVEPTAAGVAVAAGEESWQGDALLVATGRAPNVDGLFLDRAGIALGPRGIAVDQYLRTSQPHVYACGDVLGGPQFTHYAGWQGYQAVRNALLPGHAAAVRDRVPWTLFTDPEAAQVGLSEPEARARHGDGVRADVLPLERVDRALAEGDRAGFVKVVQRANGELLGAHVVAARAGELIHEYVLALGRGLRTADLAAPIHVYPTYSTAVWQLAAERQMADFLASRLGRLLRRWVRRGQ